MTATKKAPLTKEQISKMSPAELIEEATRILSEVSRLLADERA
jgi:hypothetical protein